MVLVLNCTNIKGKYNICVSAFNLAGVFCLSSLYSFLSVVAILGDGQIDFFARATRAVCCMSIQCISQVSAIYNFCLV